MNPASVLPSILALLALLAFAASAWGWGRLFLRASRLTEEKGAAYATVLGLAALAAVGGWLNLLRVSYPPILWALLAAGWALGLRSAWQRPPGPQPGAGSLVQIGAIAAAAAFLAFTLLPGAAFNPYDDFQLYFPRLVRMLQTGSLALNPFDPIGFDSLGGYAFLQAFTLLAFPLQYMNALDAVLAPVLALALVAAIGNALRLSAPVTLGALAVLCLAPPLQVNTSPVYAIAAFSLALVPAAAHHLERAASWRSAAAPGLLLAALVGSKLTAAAFLAPFALLLFLAIAATQGWRLAARSGVAVGAWTVLFLAPWIALHSANYAQWLRHGFADTGFGNAGNPSVLLGGTGLRWGGSVAAFNGLAAAALAAACIGAVRISRVDAAAQRWLAPLAALCGAAAAAYLLNTFPYDLNHAIRYSAPTLIAAVPVAVLLLRFALPARAATAAVVAVVGAALLLSNVALERGRRMLEYRTALSYPEQELPQFVVLTDWALSAEVREWVGRAQASVRPGEPILALIACPYDLLFARNPVMVASEFGLASPWIGVPVNAGATQIRRFLLEHGVRYVIWQVRAGMQTDEQLAARLGNPYRADRKLAATLLSFRSSLTELTRSEGVIHLDDGLIVVALR